MKAARAYAQAKEAVGFALRTIRPALMLREIQAISVFYSPGRLLSVLAAHYPDDLQVEWSQRASANRAYQGAIEQRCYAWIQANAHLYTKRLYHFYLDYKDM